ncbi:MAG: ABC transporter ATP-binding protein [archaeon]|nr:ABC transporter ATP-binding protein [Nanoarchaeota archaeon]
MKIKKNPNEKKEPVSESKFKKQKVSGDSRKHSKTIIELKDVWKTYYMGKISLNVLKGINLEINKGEFVAIIGPSGSGKSTLMNHVGILDTPTKGQVLLDNKDISKFSESDLAQYRGKKIGFIFQQFNLIPTLTALENVVLPSIFQNVPEEERTKRGQKLLNDVGLGERFNHKPTELSGGQQQRVAISRALINNPEIILADEPTGNLDSASGKQIMDTLSELHKIEKKTIILVTHDVELINYADRTIFLKDGVIEKITHNGKVHKK